MTWHQAQWLIPPLLWLGFLGTFTAMGRRRSKRP